MEREIVREICQFRSRAKGLKNERQRGKSFFKANPPEVESILCGKRLDYIFPLYKGATRFFELAKYLNDLGCMDFHMYDRKFTMKYKTAKAGISSVESSVSGNAWFMPDWTRPEGRQIITGKERQYEALMLMFGMHEIGKKALVQTADAKD